MGLEGYFLPEVFINPIIPISGLLNTGDRYVYYAG
jgi:hypothetical protein